MSYLSLAYRRMMPLIDVLAAALALDGALAITNVHRMPSGLAAFLGMRVTVKNLLLLLFFLAAWYIVLLCCRLYEDGAMSPVLRWKRLLMACSIGSAPVLLFLQTSTTGMFGLRNVAYFWSFAMLLLVLGREGHAAGGRLLRKRSVCRCLIVGSGQIAIELCEGARRQAFPRYDVLGFVDDPGPHTITSGIAPIIGGIGELETLLQRIPVDEVLVGLPIKSCYVDIQRVIRVCEVVGVQCKIPSLMFSCSIARPRVETAHKAIVTLKVVADDFRQVVKRAIDIWGAIVGLVTFAPVLLAIAVLIKLTSSGPALFAQTRYGLNRRQFRMYKFRTMVQDAERRQSTLEAHNEAAGPVFKMRHDPRVTAIGRILRKTSLDELPQLWNVLKGEMSLVGPRPLPQRDVSRFVGAWLMRRFSVKPGLTCLWQINGRSDTPFDRWIELDLKYIDTWSLRLDLEILAKTVSTVIRGQGAA